MPWRMSRAYGAVAAVAVLLGGCQDESAGRDAEPSPARATPAQVDSGTFTEGDERVTWRSLTGTTAQVVFEEVVRAGDEAVAERRYVLSDSLRLLRYTERRTRTDPGASQSDAPQLVNIEVEFGADQVLLRQSRMIDGEVTELAPFELEQIQRRARALVERWRPPSRRTP